MQGNVEMYKVLRKGADHPNRWSIDSLELLITSSWMENYRGILLTDLDGTIRQGSHRLHLLPSQEEIAAAGDTPNIAFTRFNEAGSGDKPIQPVIDLVKMYHTQGYYVVILTSCTCSQNTLNTLINQLEVWNVPYHAAVMRGKGNHRWPVDFKKQFIYDSGLDKFEGAKYALDDCPNNCDMFRENGFTALQVEKLEVGVKYKLINKDDYLASSCGNRGYLCNYLTECGCLVLDCIDEDGDGLISGDVVIGMGIGEGEFFAEYNEDVDTAICMEYRVIRKASKHQVCDWRKGEKLYEDEYGTLVRNEKRTKFYTDIVEWREVEKPVTLEDIANKLDSLNLPFSDKGREELIEMAAKYKQSNGGK